MTKPRFSRAILYPERTPGLDKGNDMINRFAIGVLGPLALAPGAKAAVVTENCVIRRRLNMLMHMVKVGILTGMIVAAASMPRAQADSILVNGDFEDGKYSVAIGAYTNNDVPVGWTPNGPFVQYYYYNRVLSGPVESGFFALEISNLDDKSLASLATLSQSYSDVAGDAYDVTFYARVGESSRDPNAFMRVSVGSDGLTLHDDVPTTFLRYSFSFVGTGSDTLAISAQNDPSFFFIDNISVTDVSTSSAVPEPSTWALMLGGFVGLGFVGYRRNKWARVAA